MTTPKNITEMQRELKRYKDNDQIMEVCFGTLKVIFKITLAGYVFNMALLGVKMHYQVYWQPLVGVILWALAIMWLFFELHFDCYNPILSDASEGFEILATKLKNAKEGWRK